MNQYKVYIIGEHNYIFCLKRKSFHEKHTIRKPYCFLNIFQSTLWSITTDHHDMTVSNISLKISFKNWVIFSRWYRIKKFVESTRCDLVFVVVFVFYMWKVWCLPILNFTQIKKKSFADKSAASAKYLMSRLGFPVF